MKITPTARGRLAAALIAVAGAVLANNLELMAIGYLILLPILSGAGVLRSHLRFLLIIVLPVGVFSVIVWPLLMGAPPGKLAGSDAVGAFRFAVLTTLRLAFVGGVVQACVLAIHARDLAVTFRRWGLRGEWLVAALGATILAPEMKRRADRIFTAALARGLLTSRSFWHRVRVLPMTLGPLTAWSLRSAISRADNWHERKLLERIELLVDRPDSGSVVSSLAYVTVASAWLIAIILLRWNVF